MAYIFQPDRYLLNVQVKKASHYIYGRVLDVGAGATDRYSHYFNFDAYTRMDIESVPSVDLVGSADAIPLPDESVDSVVSTQVFEHLKDPVAAAREIYRVLTPGGVALITIPQMNELHDVPNDYYRYTQYGMRQIFEPLGFTTIFEEQRGGYFSTVAQMRIRHSIDRFRLYQRPVLAKLLGFPIKIYGKWSIYKDTKDKSIANHKHTIGWCFVFKKK